MTTTTAPPLDLISARPRTIWNSRLALWLGRLLVPVLVFAGWAVAWRVTDLVPPIGATLVELVGGFTEGWILGPLWSTMKAVIGGFLVALVTGYVVGYTIGRTRFLAKIFDPIIAGLFAVPRIILYPVLLAIFGVGVASKLGMGAISAFFPIVLTTAAGIRAVNPVLVKLGRSLSCSRLQLVAKVYLPAAAPTLMVGFRIGFGVSFISVIIAEFFAAVEGLGLLVSNAYGLLQLPRMFAVVLVIAGIAVTGNLILWSAERKVAAASE